MTPNKRFTLLCGIGLLLLSNGAFAQLAASGGIMDTVLMRYSQAASQWTDPIMKAATFLFMTLGVISLAWTAASMALKGSDIQEFFGELVKFVMVFGFFLLLLRWGPFMANAIVQSMIQLGSTASGSQVVSPSALVDMGFKLWDQYVNSRLSIEDVIPMFFLTIGIVFIFAIISINLLLVYITSWFLAYAGILFLGFGGSRWTSDMAIGYYKSVFATAIQLLAMILIIGVGIGIVNEAMTKANTGLLNTSELVVIFVMALTLLLLVDKIPAALAGIISGGGMAGMQGVGSYGAAAGMGAAGAAAGLATGAALGAAGAAAAIGKAGMGNLIGSSSALKAAFNASQAGSEMTGGSLAKAFEGMDGGNGSSGSSGAVPGTASETPFAKAAGLDTGSGAAGAAGAASASNKSSFSNSASTGEASQAASGSPTDGGEGGRNGGGGDGGGAANAASPDTLFASGSAGATTGTADVSGAMASASGGQAGGSSDPSGVGASGASQGASAAPQSSVSRAAAAVASTAGVLGKNAASAIGEGIKAKAGQVKQSLSDLGANSAMGKLAKRIDNAQQPSFAGNSIAKASTSSGQGTSGQGTSQASQTAQASSKVVSAVNAALPPEVRAFMEKK